jgi:phosphate starvation-inducible protein PhoH and related proteins
MSKKSRGRSNRTSKKARTSSTTRYRGEKPKGYQEDMNRWSDGHTAERRTPHKTPNIEPKTRGQAEYMAKLEYATITFGLGPAGSGKSFLSVYQAVQAFENKEVQKIVITRPAVEAGESLGFLPGDLSEKVDPYLQPIWDALLIFMGSRKLEALKEAGLIEVAPIAFLRGRTFRDAYVLLDEAQNCTYAQMKMVLTRLGEGSRYAITGDASQSDLRKGQSGLLSMARKVAHLQGVEVHEFTAKDVVRHPLVSAIIDALGEDE